MKFGFSSDWHMSAYSQDNIDKETRLPRTLNDIVKALKNMLDYCVANSVDKFIVGGDLLHGKSIIYAIAQSCLLDLFRAYSNIHFVVIDGNHDLSLKGKDAVSALKSIDKEPNVCRIKDVFYKDPVNNIMYVPYSYNMVDIIKNNQAKYLISHFGLNEAQLSSGISIVSDISLKDLKGKYGRALLGHYHTPQEIINDYIKVYYSGSVVQLDWGEKHEDKRFLIVDTVKDTIESIPTEGYRKYYSIPMTFENKNESIEEARKLREQGHLVRLERLEKVDVSDISNDFVVVDKVEKEISNRGITSTMSEEDRLNKYTEIKEIPINKREKYLQVGLDIIRSIK